MLTIHGTNDDEGMLVLQQLRRIENVKADSELTSAYFNVWDENWKFLSDIHPQRYRDLPASALRIPHDKLLRHLIDKAERAPATKFHWQCTCLAAERLNNGLIRVTVQAADGQSSTEDCDVLVIADGAEGALGSQLRPSSAKMEYVGVNIMSGVASFFPDKPPLPIETLDSGGMQLSDGQNTCCMYLPLDQHTLRWVFTQTGPERESAAADVKQRALETGYMFNEPFRSVVEATDSATTFIGPAKQRSPFAHADTTSGMVFIGDSNHVFSVINDKGADMALKDGWDLAAQLSRSTSSFGDAVASYDRLSVPRVQRVNDFARHRIDFGHSTGVKWQAFRLGMHAQRALGKVGHKYR